MLLAPVDGAQPGVRGPIVPIGHDLTRIRDPDRASVGTAIGLDRRVAEWLEAAGLGRVVCEAGAGGALGPFGETPQAHSLCVQVVGRGPEAETARRPARHVEHQRLAAGEECP